MKHPSELFDISGHVAIVTGAGSGIGRASAMLLATAGAAVACADVDLAGAQRTVDEITGAGGSATAHQVDIAKRAQVDGLVEEVVAAHGQLDVMCNIAGILPPILSIVDVSEEELDTAISINLKGVFFGAAAAARAMLPRGQGSIINFASGAIDLPAPGIGCYALTKAAVAQMTKTLAIEVAKHGVRVNAVAPGLVPTNMTAWRFRREDGTIDEEKRAESLVQLAQGVPLGLASADDIAQTVLFLAAPTSAFFTGQVIRPNGGVAMP